MSHRLPLADIQFIADFAAFARSKGDEEYSYLYAKTCALTQFFDGTGEPQELPCGMERWGTTVVAVGDLHDALALSHTFSALADRLEALLVDAPEVELAK